MKDEDDDDIYEDTPPNIAYAIEHSTPIPDFLPPPEVMAKMLTRVRITMYVDLRALNFFKDAAAKYDAKYQSLMNEVLLTYALHHTESVANPETTSPTTRPTVKQTHHEA